MNQAAWNTEVEGLSCWAEIDLEAIRHNVSGLVAQVAPAQVLAVVKADGYGHGALEVARAAVAAGAVGVAVSSLAEAERLRQGGFEGRVLVFGPVPEGQEPVAVRLAVEPTVFTRDSIERLAGAASAAGGVLPVQLKVDTGMTRLGCTLEVAPALAAAIAASDALKLAGIYTHLASADEDPGSARQQLERFSGLQQRIEASGIKCDCYHAANSAGALKIEESRLDLVRVGLAIYGISPFPAGADPGLDLRPALTWKARVSQVREVPPGTQIGYGGAYTTLGSIRLATVSVGYADGYLRALSNRAAVLLGGRRCPVLGRVSMDMIAIDASFAPEVRAGQVVTLIGADGEHRVTADELAVRAGTIPWEITCAVSARVPRRFRGAAAALPEEIPGPVQV